MQKRPISIRCLLFAFLGVLWFMETAQAHHVLGRPAYSLNEDSNTPPALQVEVLVGDYDVNYMIFPAFPRPNEPGRINLYVKHRDTGKSFIGDVTFTTQDDTWLSKLGMAGDIETLGTQVLDDFVFRQGFVFNEAGDYIITARFEPNGEHYAIDFPLRVGAPPSWGPVGIAVAILLAAIATVSLVQRRRALSGKIRNTHSRSN